MRLQVHITTVAIVACVLSKERWWLPLLWTNSILGCYYTHVERHVLRERGVAMLGTRVRLSYAQNAAVNLVSHVALPAYLVKHTEWRGGPHTGRVLVVLALYLVCADLHELYPTEVHTLRTYVVAYFALVLALSLRPLRA